MIRIILRLVPLERILTERLVFNTRGCSPITERRISICPGGVYGDRWWRLAPSDCLACVPATQWLQHVYFSLWVLHAHLGEMRHFHIVTKWRFCKQAEYQHICGSQRGVLLRESNARCFPKANDPLRKPTGYLECGGWSPCTQSCVRTGLLCWEALPRRW